MRCIDQRYSADEIGHLVPDNDSLGLERMFVSDLTITV